MNIVCWSHDSGKTLNFDFGTYGCHGAFSKLNEDSSPQEIEALVSVNEWLKGIAMKHISALASKTLNNSTSWRHFRTENDERVFEALRKYKR